MSFVYSLLNPVFGNLLALGKPLAIVVMAIIVAVISAWFTKKFVDQKRMKEIQAELNKHTKLLREAHKTQDQKKIDEAKKGEGKMYEMQSELMRMQFPMFYSLIPVIILFLWMQQAFGTGDIVSLPFTLPYWNKAVLGWLGWYIFSSLPMNLLARKIMRVG